MGPIEDYKERLLLFVAVAVAHLARCVDATGNLDDEAKQRMSNQLALVAEGAEAVTGHGGDLLAHFGMLVQILPPLPKPQLLED